MWHDLLVALALLLVMEGVLPIINPEGMRRAMLMLAQMPDQTLRFVGLTCMVSGVILLYLVN